MDFVAGVRVLDFNANLFDRAERWVEIEIDDGVGQQLRVTFRIRGRFGILAGEELNC